MRRTALAFLALAPTLTSALFAEVSSRAREDLVPGPAAGIVEVEAYAAQAGGALSGLHRHVTLSVSYVADRAGAAEPAASLTLEEAMERAAARPRAGAAAARARAAEHRARAATVEANDAKTMDYFESFVKKSRRIRSKLRPEVLFESRATKTISADIDRDLESSGDVYRLGEGLMGLRGDVLRLFRCFENLFLGWARDYGADENHYPVLLPLEILEELGYLSQFPQHVTFCSHLPEDLPVLESLIEQANQRGGSLEMETLAELVRVTQALKPAVCLPCYRQHRNRVLDDGEGFALTMQNHVFRYEPQGFCSLSRLWDFTVRDIVFFGAGESSKLRSEVMEKAIGLCKKLDLEATIELSNDPFFLNQNRSKMLYQRLDQTKYELRVFLPHRDERLAVSSFNIHKDYYTSKYNICFRAGEPAETACVGFGLERWVYGFLSQKGLDPAGWPEWLRSASDDR